jgi:glyoxylase I family protein
LAFEVANREELERWVTHLEAHGVSNSGIIDIGFGPTLVFRDPDNMQLEFFVHPSADQLTGMLSNEDSEDARRLLDEAEQRRIKSQAEGS